MILLKHENKEKLSHNNYASFCEIGSPSVT